MTEQTVDLRIVSTKRLVVGVVTAWFLAALAASALGTFSREAEPPIALGLFFAVPIAAFVTAWRTSPLLREALRTIPLWQLTIAHVFRIEGGLFVVSVLMGTLPGRFGYPAGFGDVIAALTAVPLGMALYEGSATRGRYVAWNAFGLLDLVTAISLGILHAPGITGVLRDGVSTGMMGQLPSSLIPTFFVPLFILTHLLGFARARELPEATQQMSGPQA